MRRWICILVVFFSAVGIVSAADFRQWWPWLYKHGKITDSNTVSIVVIDEWVEYGGYASLWELGYDGVNIYAQIKQYLPGQIGGYFQIDSSFVMTAQTNLVFDSIFTTNAAGHIIIRTIDP